MCTSLRLVALALLALTCGCTSSPWQRETLFSKEGFVLYREAKVLEGRQMPLGFLHPFATDPGTIASVFARLSYRTAPLIGEPKDRILFTDAEVREFAEPIALSLGTLTPDQRLRFVVIRDRWTGAFTGPRAVSGALFVQQEGLLEIALDRLVEKVQLGDDGSAADVRFPVEPTAYTEVDEPLLPFPGAVLHTEPETGRTFRRWLEVSLADVPPRPPPKTASDPALQPAEPRSTAPQPAEPEPGETRPGETPAAADAGEPAVTEPSVTAPLPEVEYQKLRSRLETLKRLRDDGVITEDEYQSEFEKTMAQMGQ